MSGPFQMPISAAEFVASWLHGADGPAGEAVSIRARNCLQEVVKELFLYRPEFAGDLLRHEGVTVYDIVEDGVGIAARELGQ